MTATVRKVADRYVINCPGCNDTHSFNGGWSFNGDMERPTISPSLLVTTGHYLDIHKPGNACWCTWKDQNGESPFHCYRCHSFIRDGRIQFLSDCSHALAGQTVDLPPIEQEVSR